MGSGIATNFLKAGYNVTVWNRNQHRTKLLQDLGAKCAITPKEAVKDADIVFEVTANNESSQEMWLGPHGILVGLKNGAVAITCATLSAVWTDELIRHCNETNFTFFDMPMTGGRAGAESGNLILLVGGDEKKLEEIKPDLEAIAQKVYYFGKAGSGMRYKLLLNMLQAIHIVGLGEVLKIAEQNGMDVKAVGDALAERPGGTTTNLAWRDYQVKPDPINFSVEWITKDLRYAKELADSLDTSLLDDVLMKYEAVLSGGHGDADWTAVNN